MHEIALLAWVGALVACGTSPAGVHAAAATDSTTGRPPATDSTSTGEPIESTSTGHAGEGGEASTAAVIYDVGSPVSPDDECFGQDTDATLLGTVYGPGGALPIAGALVYTADARPEGIPDGVYCDACVELDCETNRYALTDADGSFALGADAGEGRYLIVRKGQFMRIAELDVEHGPTELPASLTSLPAENDPDEGLYIPRIAIGWVGAEADGLETLLAKFGLGDLGPSPKGSGQALIGGTEAFDFWNNNAEPLIPPELYGIELRGELSELLADYDLLADYHMLFLPCFHDTHTHVDALEDPEVVQNLRRWVEEGGRLYAVDFSNNFMQVPFGQYQSFYSEEVTTWEDGRDGLPVEVTYESYDPMGSYNSAATVLDDALLAWLEALPGVYKDINPLNPDYPFPIALPTLYELPTLYTLWNFAGLHAPVPQVLVYNDDNEAVNVGHKVWLEGPGGPAGHPVPEEDIHPLAVSGTYGCGRIQYTSYHAIGIQGHGHKGLLPQELTLIYTILELGLCNEVVLPPPQG